MHLVPRWGVIKPCQITGTGAEEASSHIPIGNSYTTGDFLRNRRSGVPMGTRKRRLPNTTGELGIRGPSDPQLACSISLQHF